MIQRLTNNDEFRTSRCDYAHHRLKSDLMKVFDMMDQISIILFYT